MADEDSKYLELIDNPLSPAIRADRLRDEDKLVPNQKTFVLVGGIPGSGKSEVSKILSDAMGGVVLRTDIERDKLYPPDTPDEVKYSDEAKQKVYASLVETAIAAPENTIILDATWGKQDDRELVMRKAQDVNIPVKIVYVLTSDALAEPRIIKRNAKGKDPSQASITDRWRHAAKLDPIAERHILIVNDGNKRSLEKQVKMIVKREKPHPLFRKSNE